MNHQIAIRATVSDLVNLATVAAHLQANGVPYATRSDALRSALAIAATFISVTTPATATPDAVA